MVRWQSARLRAADVERGCLIPRACRGGLAWVAPWWSRAAMGGLGASTWWSLMAAAAEVWTRGWSVGRAVAGWSRALWRSCSVLDSCSARRSRHARPRSHDADEKAHGHRERTVCRPAGSAVMTPQSPAFLSCRREHVGRHASRAAALGRTVGNAFGAVRHQGGLNCDAGNARVVTSGTLLGTALS